MRRNAVTRTAAFSVVFDMQSLIRIMVPASRSRCVLTQISWFADLRPVVLKLIGLAGRHRARRYSDSSMTNSRESTSIIISIPPGKTLFVVISRPLCECHMNAQPRSLAGLACVFEGCRFVQLALVVLAQFGIDPRRRASGPKQGRP